MQSRARGSSSTISTRTVPAAAGAATLGTDSDISLLARSCGMAAAAVRARHRPARRRHPATPPRGRTARPVARACSTDPMPSRGARPSRHRAPLRCRAPRARDAARTRRAETPKLRRTRASSDAVAQRVLDERLQNERRHERASHVGVDVPRHAQAIAEAHELDVHESDRGTESLPTAATSAGISRSSVVRSRSPSRASMSTAASFSRLRTRPDAAFNALNRKCGLSSMRSAWMRASTRLSCSRAARRFRLRRIELHATEARRSTRTRSRRRAPRRR